MKSPLQLSMHDTVRIRIYLQVSEKYISSTPDSAILFCEKALAAISSLPASIRHSKNTRKLEAEALNGLSFICWQRSRMKEALAYWRKSLKILEEIDDRKGIANAMLSIGYISQQQGENDKAIEYYGKALRMQEEIQDRNGIGYSLLNIGYIHLKQGKKTEAMKHYTEGLTIFEETGEKRGAGFALLNMAHTYRQMGEEEIRIGKKPDSLFPAALNYYAKGLAILEQLNDRRGTASALNGAGSTLLLQKKYNAARDYVLRGFHAAMLANDVETLRGSELLLSKIDSAKSDFKNALEHYRQFILYRDSIRNRENQKKAIQQQMQYEFDKKEAAAETERQKQETVAAAEVKRQKIILLFVVCSLLLVMIFAGFIYRAYLRIKKKNVLIRRHKQIIQQKQEDLLASIRYAAYLQSRIMPTMKYIHASFERLKGTNRG